MRIQAIEVLRDVRDLLSEPARWTRGEYARDSAGHETDPSDKLAVSWCGQGAIYACGVAWGMPTLRQVIRDDSTTGFDWAKPLLDALDTIGLRFGFRDFIDANDQGGREAVLRIIESAIAELESRAASRTRPDLSPRRPMVRRSRAASARERASFLENEGCGSRLAKAGKRRTLSSRDARH